MQPTRWVAVLLALAWAPPLAAQQDTTRMPAGVQLGMIYQTLGRHKVAVRPFAARAEAAAVADQVHAIMARDLDYSDRFDMTPVPPSLAAGPLLYNAWNDLGVEFLVTGELEPDGDGYLFRLALHDVVYASLKQIQAFAIPAPDSEDFRMAVHAAADEVVHWISGQPGMAASRIIAGRRLGNGSYELFAIDSDGENVHRLTRSPTMIYSPTWAPDGRRIAYSQQTAAGAHQILERNVQTGEARVVYARAGGSGMTPAYSPDGRRLAFAVSNGVGNMELHDYDVVQRCCLRRLSRGPGSDLSPSYSPDGRQIAFNSDRLRQPHVYLMAADGGEAMTLSPYMYGEPGFYTSPDWSPVDTKVAFHGRSRGGRFQIMVADAAQPGSTVNQITVTGWNEDPSWAPDGRHLVFIGERPNGTGLYVIDTMTGRERALVLGGGKYLQPDWSPTLMEAARLAADGR